MRREVTLGKRTPRPLAIAVLVAPLLLTVLRIIVQPGQAWWRYLAFAVGMGYGVAVLGGWAARRATARIARRSHLAGRVTQGFFMMVLMTVVLVVAALIDEPTLSSAVQRIRGLLGWDVVALVLAAGLISVLPWGTRCTESTGGCDQRKE